MEYVQIVCALAPNILTAPLIESITTFRHFHLLVKDDFPPFVNDFHFKMDLFLNKEAFISTLTRFPHLSSRSPLGTVSQP
jgi:hypothetical protein